MHVRVITKQIHDLFFFHRMRPLAALTSKSRRLSWSSINFEKNRNLHFAKHEASIVITSHQLRRADISNYFDFLPAFQVDPGRYWYLTWRYPRNIKIEQTFDNIKWVSISIFSLLLLKKVKIDWYWRANVELIQKGFLIIIFSNIYVDRLFHTRPIYYAKSRFR